MTDKEFSEVDGGLDEQAGGRRAVLAAELAAGRLIAPGDEDIAEERDVLVQVPLQRRADNAGAVGRVGQHEEAAVDDVAKGITQLCGDSVAP